MAAYSGAALLTLQANVKRDPDGYKDEFKLQYRHFKSLLKVVMLDPKADAKECGDLAMFMAQVIKCYPHKTAKFAQRLMDLLDSHYALLDTGLRKSLVQALILLRNRSQLEAMAVMPLFFQLFKCRDKQLRHLLFRHIISDIKNSNKHGRDEKLNRALQNFMYEVLRPDTGGTAPKGDAAARRAVPRDEAAAKRSLAVCIELWRRHVWRDARTVNVIALAAKHNSSSLMLATLKFFLGQDAANEGGGDGSGDEGPGRGADEEAKAKLPSKQDIYNATKKGTRSSKKKKKHKLERVMATVKKAARKGQESQSESFAAVHLLHDPQDFVEELFKRLQTTERSEKFETKMAIIQVISRVVGVHKLQLLNFYGYLQHYMQPHQRDVTSILACLVMACHELVPPETLAPVLKQLVDNFVHDKARPEVVTIGLKTVREMCLRCPLVMTEERLQDLALYHKDRDKQVSAAAKGLIGLFRELNPALLAKKNRGRGADLDAKPKVFGAVDVRERVDGAELLEAALAAGQGSEDDEVRVSSGSDMSDLELGSASDAELASDDEGEEAGDDEEGQEDAGEGEDSETDDLESFGSGDDEGEELDSGGEGEEEDSEEQAGSSGSDAEDEMEDGEHGGKAKKSAAKRKQEQAAKQQKKQEGSIADLKKQLAALKAAKAAKAATPSSTGEDTRPSTRAPSEAPSMPIEAERFLTEEDFERIKRLKQKAIIEAALAKHGMASTMTKAKRKRLLEAAEQEAEELAELQAAKEKANEMRVNPGDLEGRYRRRADKEERMASVLAGREGREKFGGATGRKKQKTGGLSEKEKQKKKAMPIAARLRQLQRRSEKSRKLKSLTKNFKGKSAYHTQ